MQRPREGAGSVPATTISYPYDVDRTLEAELDNMVHDSRFNFRSNEEGDKTLSQIRRGVPRHEW
jgi:hypothetical protein